MTAALWYVPFYVNKLIILLSRMDPVLLALSIPATLGAIGVGWALLLRVDLCNRTRCGRGGGHRPDVPAQDDLKAWEEYVARLLIPLRDWNVLVILVHAALVISVVGFLGAFLLDLFQRQTLDNVATDRTPLVSPPCVLFLTLLLVAALCGFILEKLVQPHVRRYTAEVFGQLIETILVTACGCPTNHQTLPDLCSLSAWLSAPARTPLVSRIEEVYGHFRRQGILQPKSEPQLQMLMSQGRRYEPKESPSSKVNLPLVLITPFGSLWAVLAEHWVLAVATVVLLLVCLIRSNSQRSDSANRRSF